MSPVQNLVQHDLATNLWISFQLMCSTHPKEQIYTYIFIYIYLFIYLFIYLYVHTRTAFMNCGIISGWKILENP